MANTIESIEVMSRMFGRLSSIVIASSVGFAFLLFLEEKKIRNNKSILIKLCKALLTRL